MSATMDNLRSDVHKPPEQLEREADSARSAVEGTLAELERRLSPGEMLDRVMDMVKRHGGEFGENLLTQVRSNPTATIVAGVGVAWLMAASKRPPPQRPAHVDRANGSMFDRASSAADSIHSTASATADSLHRTAEHAYDATADAAQRAADATRHAADRMATASRTGMRGIADGYDYLCREQPLVLGAIAIAAGAALGALLRPTPLEDELLGDVGEAARSRLRSEAEARTDDLRTTAESVVETVRDAVGGASERATDRHEALDNDDSDLAAGPDGQRIPPPRSQPHLDGSVLS